MMVQASSSVIAAGINETIPVPALPFLMTQKSSPSFRFLWNLQFVKFRGLGLRIAPAGPSPFPSLPWQLKQVPFPSNKAFPLATFSGVFAIGFFKALASANWSGGTRGFNGSFSSAPTIVAESNITAAASPKNLEKYPIRLLLVVKPPQIHRARGHWLGCMKAIKRRDYSNGVLSLSSKRLRIHHHPTEPATKCLDAPVGFINQTSCHIARRVAFAIPPSYGVDERPARHAFNLCDHYATGVVPHRHRGG